MLTFFPWQFKKRNSNNFEILLVTYKLEKKCSYRVLLTEHYFIFLWNFRTSLGTLLLQHPFFYKGILPPVDEVMFFLCMKEISAVASSSFLGNSHPAEFSLPTVPVLCQREHERALPPPQHLCRTRLHCREARWSCLSASSHQTNTRLSHCHPGETFIYLFILLENDLWINRNIAMFMFVTTLVFIFMTRF